jgi:hypothetical protein
MTSETPGSPSTRLAEDDDARDDEHPGENEASVRETDETTEAPEEFEIDDEDDSADRTFPPHGGD